MENASLWKRTSPLSTGVSMMLFSRRTDSRTSVVVREGRKVRIELLKT